MMQSIISKAYILFMILLLVESLQGLQLSVCTTFPRSFTMKRIQNNKQIVSIESNKLPRTLMNGKQILGFTASLIASMILQIDSCNALSTLEIASNNNNPLIYKSGKNPIPPKEGSKEGTKKDTNFLRCLSNCKARCQLPSDGLAKTDCVQDCQDQCCTSYEQCSFKIKSSSLGNSL